jgi:hypothetical protein
MKKYLLIALALVAAYMAKRALRHENEVIKLLWVLLGTVALNSPANTAKTRSIEDRLNALIPAVFPNTGGTVNGSMTVTGNHQVNGNLKVNTSSGSAQLEVAGNAHVTSSMQADGGFSTGGAVSAGGQVLVGGASSSATFAVAGNGHVTSDFQADGNSTVGGIINQNGAGTSEFSGGLHVGGSTLVDGNTTLRQLNGASLPMGTVGSLSGTVTTTQCAAAINGIISRLQSAGLIS